MNAPDVNIAGQNPAGSECYPPDLRLVIRIRSEHHPDMDQDIYIEIKLVNSGLIIVNEPQIICIKFCTIESDSESDLILLCLVIYL